jgi:hypothetical protein
MHRGLVLVGGAIVCVCLACGNGESEPETKWNCVGAVDGCTCSQLRPGRQPRPGVDYIDRCPAAQCCLLNSEGDEATVAICGCITVADDCEARAAQSPQTKVVTTCPPS